MYCTSPYRGRVVSSAKSESRWAGALGCQADLTPCQWGTPDVSAYHALVEPHWGCKEGPCLAYTDAPLIAFLSQLLVGHHFAP